MARTTAHLEVTVNDKQLVDHASTLKQTRDTWDSLVKAAKDFSGAYTQDMGKGFTDLGKGLAAFNRVDATNIAAVFQGLQEVAKVDLSKFVKSTESFVKQLEPLIAGTYNWANQLGRVFGYIKSLDERLDSLGIQQQRTVQLSNQFEGELKQITDAMKLQADTMKGLVQSYAGLNTAVQKTANAQDKVTDTTVKQTKEIEKGVASLKNFERAFIRHATAMFIADQWLKSIVDGFRTAAQEMDLSRVMARNAAGFQQIFEDTKKATQGMVSNLQILKSSALMSSFGIPIQNLAQNMELIQKMAIRTGQPMEYMMDSFARGVSRLSPAILDNLGLQIKLGDAYTAFAAKIGKSTDKMDAFDKKTAVLNEVLRQMGDLTKDIDPYASISGRLDRVSATFDNWLNGLKGSILKGLLSINMTTQQALGMAADSLAIYVKELKEFDVVRTNEAKYATVAINEIYQKEVDQLADRRETFLRIFTLNLMDEEWYYEGRRNVVEDYIIKLDALTDKEAENLEKERKASKARYDRNAVLSKQLEDVTKQIDALYEKYTTVDGETLSPASDEMLKNLEARKKSLAASIEYFEMLNWNIEQISKYKLPEDSVLAAITKEVRASYANQQLKALEAFRQAAAKGDALSLARSAWDLAKLVDYEKAINNIVQDRYRIYMQRESQAFAELDRAKQLVIQSQMLVDKDGTRLSLAFEMEAKQQELNAAQKLYVEMDEKANVRKGEGAEYSAEQVLAQAQKVKGIAQEVAKLQERAALDERINGLLKDQSFWTDQMKRDEAARLSGGKTREEIQMRMVVLQKELNDDLRKQRDIELGIVDSTADQLKNRISLWGFASFFLDKFVTGPAAVEKRKKELDDLIKALGLMGSGGGGGAEGAKKIDQMYDTAGWDEILIEDKLRQAARERAADALASAQKATTERLTRQEELAKLEIEILNNRRDLRIQDELFKSDAKDAKGTLADNIKLLETLRTYQEKYKDVMTFEEAMYIRGFITGIQDSNKVLMEHIRLWEQVIQGLRDYGTAADWAMKYAKGIISDTEIKVIGDLTANLGGLASTMEKALGGTADSYDLMGAGLNVIRGFTGEYIKDMKQRAKVEMLMNGAMSFAAMAMGNVPKAISHATAATMFGLVAGGAIRLPGQASGQDQKQSTQAGPLHIHLYSEMAMTDAERGYLIDRAVQQAAAEGRV
jgi:hypothetical protein